MPDKDGDGYLDSCDNCKAIKNPSQENANVHAEYYFENLLPWTDPYLGDVCDPVPVFKMERQWTDFADEPFSQADDTGGISQTAIIRGRSWLAEVNPEIFYEEELGFRFCPCYNIDNGEPMPLEECAWIPQCGAGLAKGPDGDWIKIDAEGMKGNSEYGLEQAFVKGRLGGGENPDAYSWWWYPHTQGVEPVIPSYRSTPDSTAVRIRGLIATVVSNVDPYALKPARENFTDGALRTTLTGYDLPKWRIVPEQVPLAGPTRCEFGCLWLRSWESRINPNPLSDLFDRYDRVARLVSTADGVRLQFRQGEPLDVKVDVTAPLAQLLGSRSEASDGGGWAWLTASEPGLVLARREVKPIAVIVSREATSDASLPAIVGLDKDGLALELESLPVDRAGFAPPIHLPPGGAATYSATENAVYFAGGNDVGTGGTLRRLDLSSGVVNSRRPPIGEPAQDVRGVVYDAGSDRLYVLDIEEGKARIHAHRFDTGEARLVWTAPMETPGARLGFGGSARGDLVLVRALEGRYTAWLSRIDGDGEFRLDRSLEGVGEVLDQPVMGQRELLLPVREGTQTDRLVPLWPHLFTGEQKCTSL